VIMARELKKKAIKKAAPKKKIEKISEVLIPLPLQNKDFRFCFIRKETKKPIEKDWTNKPHTIKDIIKWLDQGNNYGVMGGYGGLIIIDCDRDEVSKDVEYYLPETFTVKTGSGKKHYYYICKDLTKSLRLITKEGSNQIQWGDVITFGRQAIGAGSIHPNGKKYEVLNNLPIAEIKQDELLIALNQFLKETFETKKASDDEIEFLKKQKYENNLSMANLIDLKQLKKNGDEYFGSHPIHDSTGGMNFWVNPIKNIWHCFRCDTGGGCLSWIAVKEKIINCIDAKGKLKSDKFKEVLKIAKDKYGLKEIVKEGSYKFSEASKSFEKLSQAQEFVKTQPLFYDRHENWWLWNFNNFKYELVDEVDLLNGISKVLDLETTNSREKTEILNGLKQIGRLHIPQEIKETWIQFKDIIVDIETGERIKVNPKYFVTNPIPWKLGEGEDTPTIDKIFGDWIPEEYKIDLYEGLAFPLIPTYFIHRIFLLLGSGANGKGTYMRILIKFIGKENVASTTFDRLISGRFEVAKLYKKLVCIMGETNFNTIKKTDVLKSLCGEDLISGEFKNKPPFDFVNTAKLFMNTNSLPMTLDKTEGFYRRWKITDFINKFVKEQDVISNIPNWEFENLALKCLNILKGLWNNRIFSHDGTFEDRKKRYEERSNPIKSFIENNYIKNINSQINLGEFCDDLRDFLKANEFRELSDKAIASQLRDIGYDVRKMTIDNVTNRWVLGLSSTNTANTANTPTITHSTHIEQRVKQRVFGEFEEFHDDKQNAPFLEESIEKIELIDLTTPKEFYCNKCGGLLSCTSRDKDNHYFCSSCTEELRNEQ